jgi:hypothetical protein
VCNLEAITVLVPHLAGLAIERVSAVGRSVHALARTCAGEAMCTGCGAASRRVHSSYQRQLADTANSEVLIDLQGVPALLRQPSVRQGDVRRAVTGPDTRYGRRTCALQAVALALGAPRHPPGRLSCAVSRSMLVRLVRAAAERAGVIPAPRLGLLIQPTDRTPITLARVTASIVARGADAVRHGLSAPHMVALLHMIAP